MTSNRRQVVEDPLPDMAADRTLLDKVVADVDAQGLAQIQLNVMLTLTACSAPVTTPLGQRLNDFITRTDDRPRA